MLFVFRIWYLFSVFKTFFSLITIKTKVLANTLSMFEGTECIKLVSLYLFMYQPYVLFPYVRHWYNVYVEWNASYSFMSKLYIMYINKMQGIHRCQLYIHHRYWSLLQLYYLNLFFSISFYITKKVVFLHCWYSVHTLLNNAVFSWYFSSKLILS